jgi:hypothetical protein
MNAAVRKGGRSTLAQVGVPQKWGKRCWPVTECLVPMKCSRAISTLRA